jgi:hypothetical protein
MRSRLIVATVLLATAAVAGFPDGVREQLDTATYVYVQSERKSGELGAPAEIWFHVEGDAVWVGTRPASWRVRRIQAGRTRARVAVGSRSGPAFDATAAVVDDPAVAGRLMDAFAKKYPAGWKNHEQGFRDGFKTGERVLVRYTPK